MIELIRRIRNSGQLPKDEAAAFALGLKLFGETMLRNRESELFADIKPHFAAFMKKLKTAAKQS